MSEGVERLTQAYIERQGLEEDRARQLAKEVGGDAEVLAAALVWVETGLFDAVPVRSGYCPANLERMTPSGVFATLVRLRTHPKATLHFLRNDYAAFLKRQG